MMHSVAKNGRDTTNPEADRRDPAASESTWPHIANVELPKKHIGWADVNWLSVAAVAPWHMGCTLVLSLGLVLASVMVTFPMTLLARRAFEDILAHEGYGKGIGGLANWEESPDGFWKQTEFTVLFKFYESLSNLGSRWAVMGLAWQGWNMSKSRPLVITLAAMAFFILTFLAGAIMMNYRLMSPFQAVVIALLVNILPNMLMVAAVAKLSSRTMTWRRVLKLALVSFALDWFCIASLRVSVRAFYQARGSTARFWIRMLPPVIRRVWMHGNLHLSLRFDVCHEDARFLLMLIPIASTAMAVSSLQLVSSTYEVIIMSMVMGVLEVFDSLSMLRGHTQVELSMTWIKRLLICRRSRQLTSVFPADPCGDGGDATPVAARQQALEKEDFERRKPLLVKAALQVCVAECSSLCLVTVQLLLMPINVSGGAGGRQPSAVLSLLLISLFFEVLADGCTASLSFALSKRWPDEIASAADLRRGFASCNMFGLISFGVMLFVLADYTGVFLTSFCVTRTSEPRSLLLEACPL
ncbi:unnamed protein product [Polarella glacialis]|uniref:Uncharacterized protein n=1 Tax=Polarella glacialis TaxID=89957 RepID=A0A813DRS8_POLGL|nr:unnamed protein product [Polarella glacialis]